MDLGYYTIEIDGELVGELRKPCLETKVFVPEDFENRPDLKKISPESEILIEGREINYEEFRNIVEGCFVTTKEEYSKLWIDGKAYFFSF
ncbi:MAG: hypothetical protein ACOC1P_05365 [Minisyncoccales bacterium]